MKKWLALALAAVMIVICCVSAAASEVKIEPVFESLEELYQVFDRDDMITYGDTWAEIVTKGVPALRERGFCEVGFFYLLPTYEDPRNPKTLLSDYRKSLKIGTIGDAAFMEFDLNGDIHWVLAAMKSDVPVMLLADRIEEEIVIQSGNTTDEKGNVSLYGETTDENGNKVILPLITPTGGMEYGCIVIPPVEQEEFSYREVYWLYFEDTGNLYMMCSDYMNWEKWLDFREPTAMFNGAWSDLRDLPYVTNEGLAY